MADVTRANNPIYFDLHDLKKQVDSEIEDLYAEAEDLDHELRSLMSQHPDRSHIEIRAKMDLQEKELDDLRVRRGDVEKDIRKYERLYRDDLLIPPKKREVIAELTLVSGEVLHGATVIVEPTGSLPIYHQGRIRYLQPNQLEDATRRRFGLTNERAERARQRAADDEGRRLRELEIQHEARLAEDPRTAELSATLQEIREESERIDREIDTLKQIRSQEVAAATRARSAEDKDTEATHTRRIAELDAKLSSLIMQKQELHDRRFETNVELVKRSNQR
jgi:hypothetical protein